MRKQICKKCVEHIGLGIQLLMILESRLPPGTKSGHHSDNP